MANQDFVITDCEPNTHHTMVIKLGWAYILGLPNDLVVTYILPLLP